MFKHVYPAWHKPVQKCFFVVAVILCIALPVAYGTKRRPRPFKAKVMGAVLGAFFGVWLLFTLFVRFCVRSPRIESSLPIYTPSPIPVPVFLHSPTRPNAQPASPAIRLHPSSSAADPNGGTATITTQTRGARFADTDLGQGDDNDDQVGGRAGNNVTFQARPRGYTAGSTNSEGGGPAYPTFAAYRQAQHGNIEAFTQRIKRAFAISQQEEELQRIQRQREQEEQLAAVAAAAASPASGGGPGIYMQSLSPGAAHGISNASNRSLVGSPQQQQQSRSRSASAASIIGDFAERIKNGTLFSRSQTSILPVRSATDPQPQARSQTRGRPGTTGLSISGAGLEEFGQSSGGTNISGLNTNPGIEVMLADESDEQSPWLQQQQQQQQWSVSTEQDPLEDEERAPISLATITPSSSMINEEKTQLEKETRIPRRQDSEDTVVVTMDGIRRPSVNSGNRPSRAHQPVVENLLP